MASSSVDGDRFIAWFPLRLSGSWDGPARILEAIWHFTSFINITQLCVDSPSRSAFGTG